MHFRLLGTLPQPVSKLRAALNVIGGFFVAFIATTCTVAALSSCSPTGLASTAPRDARTVLGTGIFLNSYQWEQTPWRRPGDSLVDFPVYIIVTYGGYACRVSGADWALALPDELYSCKGKWLAPRRPF